MFCGSLRQVYIMGFGLQMAGLGSNTKIFAASYNCVNADLVMARCFAWLHLFAAKTFLCEIIQIPKSCRNIFDL